MAYMIGGGAGAQILWAEIALNGALSAFSLAKYCGAYPILAETGDPPRSRLSKGGAA